MASPKTLSSARGQNPGGVGSGEGGGDGGGWGEGWGEMQTTVFEQQKMAVGQKTKTKTKTLSSGK